MNGSARCGRAATSKLAVAVVALWVVATATADAAEDYGATEEKLKAALAMDHRSEENRARDDNRDPVAAMRFCGLRDDMTVIEFGPGGGWYTELLGPVLQESGRLFIVYKDEWMEKLAPLLARDVMSAVRKHPIDLSWHAEEKHFVIAPLSYDVADADLALNIREYHNLDTVSAANLNRATYEALKPGGLYCIVDHTRRHMEPRTEENRRRADPVRVVLEVQAAGFELVDSSDLFFKPDDELRYDVGRKSVTGNSDRFSLLFRKPGA